MKKRSLAMGDILYAEGEDSEFAYIVDKGRVGLFKTIDGEELQLATICPGEMLGELAMLEGSVRLATARALEPVSVVEISRQQVMERLKSADPFTRGFVRTLFGQLRNLHRTYLRRARSADDYLNVITFYTHKLRLYMEKPAAKGEASETLKRLDTIDKSVAELRDLYLDHMDKRFDELTENDVS
ncbi:MAG: cyclic nucleotide-binding domain-containing protein [Magnetovibrionaceae bacterium]